MQKWTQALWLCCWMASAVACGDDKDSAPARKPTSSKGGAGGAGVDASGAAGVGLESSTAGTATTPPANAIEYAGLNGVAQHPFISHVFTADPSARVFEGRVYLYASHDLDTQGGYNMRDYHVFSTNDLVNWQDHGEVINTAAIKWASTLYAPDAAYGKATGKYYLYFPNGSTSIGVAVSDKPGGPFVDALGKPLIDKRTPGVEDVDWIFDPACFVDRDGQAYLYFGGGMQGTGDNARVIRLGADMISLADPSATTIVAPDFFEASFMHERGGKYYFSYSTTTATHAATIDYVMSDNPMTGFQYVGTLLPNPTYNYSQNNHHSIVEYEGKWYVIYHDRSLTKREQRSVYQRSVVIDNLDYDADGKVVPPSRSAGKVTQLRNLDAFSRLEAETMADNRGVEVAFAEDAGVRIGVTITDVHDQDWIGYSQVDFGSGASRFQARVASGASAGGTIEIYLDGSDMFTNLTGKHIGSCPVPASGGWQIWTTVDCAIEATAGVHDLYLRFSGVGAEPLLNIDYYQFE